MTKGGLARERFRKKQQDNRIISQLNQLKAEGFSTDQIRAAGNNAYQTLAGTGNNSVVVADGDTLASIAEANGTTEQNILQANPEMNAVQVGMVLNAPNPANQAMRGRGYMSQENYYAGAYGDAMQNRPGAPGWRDRGGVGLPSNSALGGLTMNPQGINQMDRGRGTNRNNSDMPFTPQTLATVQNQYQPPTASTSGAFFVPGGLSQAQRDRIRTNPTRGGTPATPLQPPQAPTANPARPSTLPSTYPGGFRRWAGQEMEQINSPDYTPNDMTLKVLEKAGLIKKTPTLSGGGGGGYAPYKRGKGGRGGGGRGGGMQPKAYSGSQQGDRLPAFSNGGGFGGLINWRI